MSLTKESLLALYDRRLKPPADLFEKDPWFDILTRESLKPVSFCVQILRPFEASGMAEDLLDRVWEYVDDSGSLQGEFTTVEMDSWYMNGLLPDSLLVGMKQTDRLVPLS